MRLHNAAFWAMSFFLVGVLAASALSGVRAGLLLLMLATALFVAALFAGRKFLPAALAIFIFIGFFYAQWFNVRHVTRLTAPTGTMVELRGVVTRVSKSENSQQIVLDLRGQYGGVVRATVRLFPVMHYGDLIALTGTLQSPPADSKGYFLKEGIDAAMQLPKKVEVLDTGQGSPVKAKLLALRGAVEESFQKIFSPEQATLMTGLVLGKSGGFSKEFTEKLKATGTTHLVALSGYNISVIVGSLLWLLAFVVSRRYGVWLCILAVVGFVVMTGAEASVVRAAVMAGLMLLAEQTSRVYSVRNAVTAAAVAMVLYNPNVLAFDVGFQLSFLALLGIVYLQPALVLFLKISDEPGLLKWKENLVTTLAAQLAVLPILLFNFGSFAPISFVTNVLLLSFIPYTMALGFFVFFASLFSPMLALAISLPAKALLAYELGVIDLFSRWRFEISVSGFPLIVGALYYLAVFFLIYLARRRAAA